MLWWYNPKCKEVEKTSQQRRYHYDTRTKQRAIEEILDNLGDNDIVDVNNAYQDCINGDKYIYSTDDFDDLMSGQSPTEIANRVAFGDYNPYHMWFWFNGYGNIVSGDYPDRADGWFASDISEYAVENDEDFGNSDIREILDENEEEDEDEAEA